MTGHTAMHVVPKTARRILALVAALATLLALFGGLSLAPAPAHAATYTMTFDPNGGSTPAGSVTSVSSDASGKVSPTQLQGVTTPTHSGSGEVFTGWYTSRTGGGRLDMHAIRRLTSDETWYAHWAQYSVTFDAGSGNYFSADHATKDTDPTGSHPQKYVLYPDSTGHITAAQIESIPDAFHVSGTASNGLPNVQIVTSWRTASGYALPTGGFAVSGDTTFSPASWDTDPYNLMLVSTNILSVAGELTSGGHSTPASTNITCASGSACSADSWSGVPGILTGNSSFYYEMNFNGDFNSSGNIYRALVPNSEVILFGLPGEKIDITPYYNKITARGFRAFSYYDINQSDYYNDSSIPDFGGFDNHVIGSGEPAIGLWGQGARKYGAFYTSYTFPLSATGSKHINLFPALVSTAAGTKARNVQAEDAKNPGEKHFYEDLGFHPDGSLYTDLESPYTMPDATTLWGSRTVPGQCQNKVSRNRGRGDASGADQYEVSCMTPLNLNLMDVVDRPRHFIGWARKQQSSQSSWTDEDLREAGLTSLLPAYARNPFFADFHGYVSPISSSGMVQINWMDYYGWWGYKATLDANGGAFSDNSTTKYVYSNADGVLSPATVDGAPRPTRDGYAFEGWATTASAASANADSYLRSLTPADRLSSDVTFYAVWERHPTMTFDAAGGSLDGLSSMQLISEQNVTGHTASDWVVSAAQLSRVPEPVLKDASGTAENFEGWYLKNKNGTVSNTKLGTAPYPDHDMTTFQQAHLHLASGARPADETWVAKYSEKKFQVEFDPGAGGHVLALTALTPSKGYGMQPKPTWTMEPNSTAGSTYTASEDADHPFTVQASKTSNLSGPDSSGIQRLGGTYTARRDPDSSDHSYRAFLGWSTVDPASHSDATSHLVSMPDWGNEAGWFPSSPTGTVLYAVYSDVKFDLNDSTGRPAHLDWNLANSTFQQFPTAHRTGFVFQGWTLVSPTDKGWTGTCIPGVDGTGSTQWGMGDCGNLKAIPTSDYPYQVPQDSLWRAKWTPVTYRVKLLDSWEDPRYAYYTSPVGSGIYNKTGKYFGSLLDPTIDVQEDATDDANGVNTFTVWLPSTVSTDSSVVPSTVNYAPYRLTGWASYASDTGYDFPDRVPFDWSDYQAMRRTHTPSATYTDIQTSGSHRGMIPYTITVQPSDYQVLSTDNTEEASGGLHSWLEPMRAFDLYGLFEERSVKHLPSAGGTAWSLLLMAPLLLLLLIVGAMIMRRRGLVPVAPDHQPLHVAPHARHAA